MMNLLSFDYFFAQRPPTDSLTIYWLAGIFGAFLILSGIAWIALVRKERNSRSALFVRIRLVPWLAWTGSIGLVLTFFRWQGIPTFASRWLMAIWVITVTIWGVKILIYLLKTFPKQRRLETERSVRERYLPKSK